MSKWESRGFTPQNYPERERTRQVEEELLQELLPVILENSDRIIETPHYFFCQLVTAWLSTWFLYGGGGWIPLGVLCLLWEAGEMLFECPACGGSLHATGIGGSPLSGWATAWGICIACRTWQFRSEARGSRTIHVVGRMLGQYGNQPVVERGKQPRFDWKEGLLGESTPDRVIVPAVDGVNLWTLLRDLSDPTSEGGAGQLSGAALDHAIPALEKHSSRGLTFPFLLEKRRPLLGR